MKSTYIIGAGASMDFGFPTGNKLKDDISEMYRMEGGRFVDESLNRYLDSLSNTYKYEARNDLIYQASALYSALPTAFSIDNYLDAHSKNVTRVFLGKLGILFNILNYENRSSLNIRNQEDYVFDSTILKESPWHLSFFHSLIEGCDFEGFIERLKLVTLIIFNYDRCVEQFLLLAIQVYYEVTEAEAARAMMNLMVIHPYGSIGSLPQLAADGSTTHQYGEQLHFGGEKPSQLVKGLNIFTEDSQSHSDSIRLGKQAIRNSERIITLGFAFHHMNLKLLSLNAEDLSAPLLRKQVYGTAFNVSDSDVESIKSMCRHFLRLDSKRIVLANQKCDQFFDSFRLSLNYER